MNFEEHAGKPLLKAAGIPVPDGGVAYSAGAAAEIAEGLTSSGGKCVVKAQVPTGKRGKAGGIKVVDNADDARAAAGDIIGMTIGSHEVEKVLVEAATAFTREFYAAVINDPETKGPKILFSRLGGMDVEEAAEEDETAMKGLPVDIRTGPELGQVRAILADAGIDGLEDAVADVLMRLYDAYRANDAELLEINPLAVTEAGGLIALDCKFTMDDSALPRHEETAKNGTPDKLTGLEARGKAMDLKYIELDGDVGVIANGAGLTMTTMDVVRHHGGDPANFLEIGGESYTKGTEALSLVLENPKVKSLVINFCGAFARTDVMTDGILKAWEELKPDLPTFWSVHGTGDVEAVQMLKDRIGVDPLPDMSAACKAAVDAAKGAWAMVNRGSHKVIVQGITGKQGTFWSERMIEYGTKIVGGVNPKKAGTEHIGLPVFGSAVDAMKGLKDTGQGGFDVSILFIPPMGAKAAALDAIEAGAKAIVCLTEHIPVQDVMYMMAAAAERGTRIIGPNTAGGVTPGECFTGFMPAFNEKIFRAGNVGIISRSGSLGTLMALNVVSAGFGISAFIGIGGDPIIGTTTRDALIALDEFEKTDAVVMVGEIGGAMEEHAAEYAAGMDKPMAAFIAGGAAPPGKKMGHAGAIVMGDKGTYKSKADALSAAGVAILDTPMDVGPVLKERMG